MFCFLILKIKHNFTANRNDSKRSPLSNKKYNIDDTTTGVTKLVLNK